MIMKKINNISFIKTVLLLFATFQIFAQQLPVTSHYVYNPYLYNPARTGQNDFGSININFKKQWLNMPQSPITGILTGETRLSGKFFKNMGVGGMIYTDQMHIIDKIGGMATYAYHIPFGDQVKFPHRFSAGISLGVLYQRFNFNDATVINSNDMQVLAESSNGTTFDFSVGVDYQFRNLHIGASMLQGLNNSLKFINPNNDNDIQFINTRHYIFTASYRFNLLNVGANKLFVEPTAMGRYIDGLPFQGEGTLLLGVSNIGFVGAGYRSSNTETATSALSFTAGFEIAKKVHLIYTIDLGVGQDFSNSLGTQHEFMISYKFGTELSRLNQEIENLNNKAKVLEDELINKNDSIRIETKKLKQEQQKKHEEHEQKQEELKKRIDELNNNSNNYKETIITNNKEIERLKTEVQVKKITHKNIGQVYFDKGSDKLNEEIKAHLESMKNVLANYPKNITVYLYGNASVEGDAKLNMELAIRRGSAVRNQLIKLGLKPEKLIVIPMGEHNPMNGDPTKVDRRDRRIDIMVNEED